MLWPTFQLIWVTALINNNLIKFAYVEKQRWMITVGYDLDWFPDVAWNKHGKRFETVLQQLPKINQCQLKGSSVWVNSLPEGLQLNTNLSKCYCITQIGGGGPLIFKLPAHLWIASCSFHVLWAGCQLLMTGKYKTFKRIYDNNKFILN